MARRTLQHADQQTSLLIVDKMHGCELTVSEDNCDCLVDAQ